MKKILLSALTLLVLVTTACRTNKAYHLMVSGEIEQEDFNVKVPFEYTLGLISLKVNIAGEEYHFFLDTGAPNVISKELAKKLKLRNDIEKIIGDNQGNYSKLGFSKIDKLSIGDLHFLNTGTAIADLKFLQEATCLKIDGIIGSNLMKKAIWKFDYQNQTITITNSREKLNISELASKIPFTTNIYGTPLIDIQLNSTLEENVSVDLGSAHNLELSKKTFDSLTKSHPTLSKTFSFGNAAAGLYGNGKADSTYYVKTPNISFGDISLENTVVGFRKNIISTLGTNFFKNYELIIDWFTKEIFLVNKSNYDYSTLANFGFAYSIQDGQLMVTEIYENMQDLELGDQILEINQFRYEQLTSEQWCEIFENGLIDDKLQEISITILRDNKELQYTLKRTNLL
jgi:hypothetical protein